MSQAAVAKIIREGAGYANMLPVLLTMSSNLNQKSHYILHWFCWRTPSKFKDVKSQV